MDWTKRIWAVIQAREPMIRKEGVGPTAISSSHFIFQKCLQHAIRPNRTMSPLVDSRGLSTLPHGNAVTTVDFRPVTLAWKGLAPF